MTHGTRKSRAELKRKQHGWTNGRLTADIYEARERIAALEAALRHVEEALTDDAGIQESDAVRRASALIEAVLNV